MNKNVRLGLVLPLVGVTVAWLSMMIATFMDLGYNYITYFQRPEVRLSTYVVLAGFAVASGLVLWGFRLADGEHVSRGDVPLVRAVYRFGGLMIVLALAADTVFAFVTFLTSLDMSASRGSATLYGRTMGVYVPILLDTALVVLVLLAATIWRKSSPVESEGSGISATQKALALGYAVPVIGAALAIIIGLAVFDFQRQSIQNWAWVVIQAILGIAIIFGTRFAAKARMATPVVRAPKVAGAAGAVRLNYVLSLVFAGVVSFMSFGFGTGAISSLASPICDSAGNCKPEVIEVTASWWSEQMVPSFLLLVIAQVATYVVIVSRNKEVAAA